MAVLGQNRGRGGAMLTSNELVLIFGALLPLCRFSRKWIKKCARESADRQSHAQRQTEFIICAVVLCAIAMGQITSLT